MPSFTELFSVYHKNRLEVNGKKSSVPYWAINKLKVEEFCATHKIDRPRVLRVWDRPDEISVEGLPETFVVKPANLNSSRGVLVLESEGNGTYYDHYSKRQLDLQGIIEVQQEEYDKIVTKEPHRLKAYKVIAQERMIDRDLESGAVTDFKFWVVGNSVKCVMVKDGGEHEKMSICFYDRNFEPLPERNDKVVLIPEDAVQAEHRAIDWETRKEMIKFAENVSAIMDAPFVRIDLFLTESGIKLGEITPVPASPYNGKNFSFTSSFDRELGEAWAKSLGLAE